MRDRNRRAILRAALPSLLLAVAAGPVLAQGKVYIDIYEADAEKHGNDACGIGCNGQDFWVQVSNPPYVMWWASDIKDDRDNPSWNPFQHEFLVDPTRRFHEFKIELWDDDDLTGDDRFDITPLNGHDELTLQFDICRQMWTEFLLPGEYGPGRSYPPLGTRDPEFNGKVVLDVYSENRLPPINDDISIISLNPVQVAFDPEYVASDKATAIRIQIASTYDGPTTLPVPVTIVVSDGINTWAQTRSIVIPPGLSTWYFFDGMNGTPPFLPHKPTTVDHAWITYSANLDIFEMAPLGTPPDLMDCYLANNSAYNKQTPIARTSAPITVFVPYDFLDSIVAMAPFSDVLATAQRDEPFRRATWPLANLTWVASGFPVLSVWNPVDPITWLAEPYKELALQSLAAKGIGIEKLVLVTRKGWFKDNDFRSIIWPDNSIGLSIGPVGPHAVIVEADHHAVSTHELGHTYDLSQRKCSHDDFSAGCRDEYTHSAADGWPYLAKGLDVEGVIFPSGMSDPDFIPDPNLPLPPERLRCDPVRPGTREVCLKNIMDVQDPNGLPVNWTDTYTENTLINKFKSFADPELISLTGVVHSTNGVVPGIPPVFEGRLEFSYHTMGIPDLLDPPAGSPPGSYAGQGRFSVHVHTANGVKIYRFAPDFHPEGDAQPLEGAYFSFYIPWDPTTFGMTLFAPMNLWEDCEEGTPCAEVPIFNRSIIPGPVQVNALRAGRDVPPPLLGPPPPVPTIGPGHSAVIAWAATQPTPGPEGLRTILYMSRVGPAGGPEQWIPVRIADPNTQFSVPQEWLAGSPGTYMGMVMVSNGILSTSYTSGPLFNVCNLSNGGVEVCNGIDDDCDGLIDNAAIPDASGFVSLNPQPLPPGIDWSPVPGAETYDLVMGDLSALRANGLTGAVLGCLANDIPGTSFPAPVPLQPGQGVWFLARPANCAGPGSFNTAGGSQAGPRDAAIAASPASCPQ